VESDTNKLENEVQLPYQPTHKSVNVCDPSVEIKTGTTTMVHIRLVSISLTTWMIAYNEKIFKFKTKFACNLSSGNSEFEQCMLHFANDKNEGMVYS